VIQLVPDLAPRRVKLGWAVDVNRRLTLHRCSAPTARLVRSWACHREWESTAIRELSAEGCQRLSRESFDVADLDQFVERVEAFFRSNPASHPQPRTLRPGVKLARLKRARERAALSQAELARKAGVSRVTVARVEGLLDEPQPRTVRKLAQALEVAPADLMDQSDDD
jgi:DNA-binding XRE family transcriptional regulator